MENSQWVMQSYRSVESAPVTQLAIDERPLSVRVNDSDAEQEPLVVTLVSGPTHASSFTLTSAGTFSYQHNGDFATEDSFVYRISDSNGGTATATATIHIASVNTPPTISAISDRHSMRTKSLDRSTLPLGIPSRQLLRWWFRPNRVIKRSSLTASYHFQAVVPRVR